MLYKIRNTYLRRLAITIAVPLMVLLLLLGTLLEFFAQTALLAGKLSLVFVQVLKSTMTDARRVWYDRSSLVKE